MYMSKRILQYTEAYREATDQLMKKDDQVHVLGLGVTYKNGADGTTGGLLEKYPGRVHDIPVSENAATGMCVGAAISGLKPIIHHGRIEFALFAADQIFTQAAKWNYMFDGGDGVPVTFRIAIGRQWGNGPQHTQSLYGLFGSASGLKVVIPSTPYMVKGLMIAAVSDPNPVIVIEPRWLYKIKGPVPAKMYVLPLDKAVVDTKGKDITVVSYGDGFIAAKEALDIIGDMVSVELIDLVSINPVDHKTILNSVKKTKRLLTVDTTHVGFSVGSEVISGVSKKLQLKKVPEAMTTPDAPCPTSPALTEDYYPTKVSIANKILTMLGKKPIKKKLSFDELHLAPNITLE